MNKVGNGISGSYTQKELQQMIDDRKKASNTPKELLLCLCGLYIPDNMLADHYCKEKYVKLFNEGCNQSKEYTDLHMKYAELNLAAVELIDKIKEVETSPEYKAAFTMNQVHGMPYNGPNYGAEINKLENLIDREAARIEAMDS